MHPGNITCDNIDNIDNNSVVVGHDASTFYYGDRSNDFVTYDVGAVGIGATRGVAAAMASRLLEPNRLLLGVADDGNGDLFMVDSGTNLETTIGMGSPWDVVYKLPAGRTVGCFLVSDRGSQSIEAVDLADLAGGPKTLADGFNSVRGIGLAPDGSLYVADSGFDIVVRLLPSSNTTDCL